MLRNILNLIKFNELTPQEREKLKKILKNSKDSLEATIEDVNRKLKKPTPNQGTRKYEARSNSKSSSDCGRTVVLRGH
jgi:hypothetical protein